MNAAVAVPASGRAPAPRQSLTIAVVNNMPEAARRATVRQFRNLLGAGATEHDVIVKFYREHSRGSAVEEEDVDALFDADADGIIVTGAEPRTARLADDPVRPLVGRLVDWAEDTATPAIWSCLAAHAAVLHLHGIERVKLEQKVSGIFAGEILARRHPVMADIGGTWMMPHSRHNTLPEDVLQMHGYSILVWSEEVGVDLFERRGVAPALFLQSHPEYDADTLQREFQRDLKRFDMGERATPPLPPCHYVGEASWRPAAVTLYRNWFRELAERKSLGLRRAPALGATSPELRGLSDFAPC